MKTGIEKQAKNMKESLSKSLAASMGPEAAEQRAEAYADAWEAKTTQAFGLDEESQKVAKLNEKMRKSFSTITQYADLLRRTGNASEYATNKLQEMVNAFVEQKFEALDSAQQQKVIDELEKMGGRAGGEYAKAMADQIKGGVKNAAKDALAEIKPISDSDVEAAITTARDKEKQREERKNRGFTPVEFGEIEIEINGRMRTIRKQEAREIEEGNREVVNSLKSRFEAEDRLLAQNEANLKEYYQKANEWRKKAGLEPVGPKEYREEENKPEDIMKGLGEFGKALQKITGAGSEAAKAYAEEFQNTLMSAKPITPPPVQPPKIDASAMLQDVQARIPQISQTMSQSFSGLRLTLPSSVIDGFFNEIIERINSGAATVSLALSTAFSAIDLTPAGVTVAESFTNGILNGIESSGFVLRLYEKIMNKFSDDLAAAGGVR
jgi:hypothetical protein